jgi:hypothetical protein
MVEVPPLGLLYKNQEKILIYSILDIKKKTLRLHVLTIDFRDIICFFSYPQSFELYQSATVN